MSGKVLTKTIMRHPVNVAVFSDPHCTWSWGHEGTLRALEQRFKDQVTIERKMGGFIPDIRNFFNTHSGVNASNWTAAIAEQWRKATQEHGMPVDPGILDLMKPSFTSTFPAGIACKAAQLAAPERADRFIRRVSQAVACERRPIHLSETLEALAIEVGIDRNAYNQSLLDGSAHAAHQADILEATERDFRQFPVFVLTNQAGEERIVKGYQKGQIDIESPLAELLGDESPAAAPSPDRSTIDALLNRYGSTTVSELASTCAIERSEAQKALDHFVETGGGRRVAVGTGHLYTKPLVAEQEPPAPPRTWHDPIRLRVFKVHQWLARRIRHLNFADVTPASTWSSRIRSALVSRLVRRERLMTPIMGPFAFQMLFTGNKIGLFEVLKDGEGMTLSGIRMRFGLAAHSAEVLLVGLCSLKILHLIGGRYYVDPYFARVLDKDFHDGFFDKGMDFIQHLVWPTANKMLESTICDQAIGLKHTFGEVESFYEAIARNPDRMKYFDRFMQAVTSINEERIAHLPQLKQFTRIIDVGGSTGRMAQAIANAHAHADVTVFDFPSVVTIADANFAASAHQDRLHTIGGNLLSDEIPRGYDCIAYCHLMGVFSEARNIANIEKAHRSLEAGKCLLLITPVLDDQETGPLSTGLFSSYFLFLANGNGRFYSVPRVLGWLEKAGFVNIEVTRLPANEAVFLARKG
jgi:predicted DsbA family dithiol-disulfide isomerase